MRILNQDKKKFKVRYDFNYPYTIKSLNDNIFNLYSHKNLNFNKFAKVILMSHDYQKILFYQL